MTEIDSFWEFCGEWHDHNCVLMRHKITGQLVRSPLTEIIIYEKNGYERIIETKSK